MTDRSVLKISSITVAGATALNIVHFRYDFIIKDKVRYTPNTTSGIAIRNFPKYHRVVIVFDSVNNLFDAYADEDGVNPPIPSLSISMLVKNHDTGAEQNEIWTFQANKTYVMNKGESRIDRYEERRPWEVELICIGTRARSWT